MTKTKNRVAAGIAAATIAIGAAFAGHNINQPTPAPTCPVTDARCAAEQSAPEQAAQPGVLGAVARTSGSNGNLSSSSLAPATGCTHGLAKPAAAAWNHVAVIVHAHTGYWLQSNGDASCYRTYAQQVELRNYWCSQGACGNAAVPGTSNHGWGLAVDGPPATVSYIHQYSGGLFGQGYGSCSDAPWESWHIKYCGGYSGPDPGAYGSGGGGPSKPHFRSLSRGSHGPRVKQLSTRLAILRRPTPKHPHYIAWKRRTSHYNKAVAFGVHKLQRDGHLKSDGVFGPHTHVYLVHRWHAHKASK
jgi:hypothetical protein